MFAQPLMAETSSKPCCIGPHLYHDRNHIERFFKRIKPSRRIATRYEKLTVNALAFIKCQRSDCGLARMDSRHNQHVDRNWFVQKSNFWTFTGNKFPAIIIGLHPRNPLR